MNLKKAAESLTIKCHLQKCFFLTLGLSILVLPLGYYEYYNSYWLVIQVGGSVSKFTATSGPAVCFGNATTHNGRLAGNCSQTNGTGGKSASLGNSFHAGTTRIAVREALRLNNLTKPAGNSAQTNGTGGKSASLGNSFDSRKIRIAVGGALSLKKLAKLSFSQLTSKYCLFTIFLPSFCRTASVNNYQYEFYFVYDFNDLVLANNESRSNFERKFLEIAAKMCPSGVNVTLTLAKCDYDRKPAWAQNDAMMIAHNKSVDYFYRVNDDTEFQTKGWTEAFINQLNLFKPPKVGVVGPKFTFGNTDILTYDFVHRTHVDIFGFYYPRNFTDWYADTWITKVYLPTRSKKMVNISIKHTNSLGTRYIPTYKHGNSLASVIRVGVKRLKDYLAQLELTS